MLGPLISGPKLHIGIKEWVSKVGQNLTYRNLRHEPGTRRLFRKVCFIRGQLVLRL